MTVEYWSYRNACFAKAEISEEAEEKLKKQYEDDIRIWNANGINDFETYVRVFCGYHI